MKLLWIIPFLLVLTMYQASAHDSIVHPSWAWSVKKFFNDVKEDYFAPPGLERVKLKAQHALDYQEDFERGETSQVVQDAIAQKTASVQQFLDEKQATNGIVKMEDGTVMTPAQKYDFDIVGKTISALNQARELNEIRILYNDFKGVLERNDPAEVATFNKKINDLEIYRKNCIDEFDIRNFRNDPESFKRLQQLCPPLETKSATELKRILYRE